MKNGIDVSVDGTKEWWVNGQLHREDGPAIEHAGGSRIWCQNDKIHREDGPAYEESDGTRVWYIYDVRHREDGPAVEFANGTKMWYIKGVRLTLDEFIKRTKKKKFTADEIESLQSYNIQVDS
jgi:hypothetical protein